MKTVIIDPGHGGNDSGALSSITINGLKVRESDIALKVALIAEAELEDYDCQVILTRRDDIFLTLQDRANRANAAGADCFLSLHLNAFSSATAEGYECFTTPGETEADPYATLLLDEWEKHFPGQAPRLDFSDGDADKEANFAVLRATRAPAALFEMGFLTNSHEAQLAVRTDWQAKAGRALARATAKFLGLERKNAALPSESEVRRLIAEVDAVLARFR